MKKKHIEVIDKIRYMKIYKRLKSIYFYLKQEYYPTAHLYQILFTLKHREYELKKIQLYSVENYCQEKECIVDILAPVEKCEIYKKPYDEFSTKEVEEVAPVPEVFSANLQDVSVIGGCNYIIKNNKLLVSNYTEETARDFVWTNETLKIKVNNNGEIRYKKGNNKIEKALFFCGNAPVNYYHFLMETLPRLALCEQLGIYDKIPVVLDERIKQVSSLNEAFDIVNVKKHKVIWLKTGEIYDIHNMIYISATSWIPVNLKNGLWPRNKDFVFCRKAVECMRQLIVDQCENTNVEKLFIARYMLKNKRLKNDREVAELCSKNGFEVIFPEKLPFIKQVAYFCNAKYIIACAGAACTNAIFCSSSAKIYMIVPREHESLLWPTVIKNLDVSLLMIDAKITKKATHAPGDEFEVDLNKIERIINMEIIK